MFISHKLSEVMEICDDVVVLRDGAVSGHVQIADATRESLARMMVERDLSAPVLRKNHSPGEARLTVEGLSRRDGSGGQPLQDISFTIRAGEILAVAGVDGNGQRELLDTLAGITPTQTGRIVLNGIDITRMNVRQRLEAGLAYIPVDRASTSLVPGFTIADNLAMRDIDRPPARLRTLSQRPRGAKRWRAHAWRPSIFGLPVPMFQPAHSPAATSKRSFSRAKSAASRKCCWRSSLPGGSIPAPRAS